MEAVVAHLHTVGHHKQLDSRASSPQARC
jgi:hypothetical protein